MKIRIAHVCILFGIIGIFVILLDMNSSLDVAIRRAAEGWGRWENK